MTKTFLGFIESAYADAPEREAIELCHLTAHLHASEMGSSMYKYAQADTPDNAILHFRHPKSGRTWTTNYVCSLFQFQVILSRIYWRFSYQLATHLIVN